MKVTMLRRLLAMARTLNDRDLADVAALPTNQQRDYVDRVIVAVARGEIQWRAET